MATEQIILDIRAQVADAKRDIAELKTQVGGVNKEVDKSSQLFTKAAGTVAALFSVAAVANFTRKIIEVRSEFEKYNAVLKNTLGSAEAANIAFEKIQKFASETPFSVRELTNAFVKLTNQGFKPTTESLRKLGDLAASTGKSFDQLTEAIIDATVGEFERLKEFGIRAKKSGDQVKFTFKEVETQVAFTRAAIEEYILSLGDLQGVSGAMAEISETLGGKISNLGDNWDSLLDTLGGRTSGVFTAVISALNTFLSKAELAAKSIHDLRMEAELLTLGDVETASVEEFIDFVGKFRKEGETYFEVAQRFLEVDKNRIDSFDRLTTKTEGFRTVQSKLNVDVEDLLTDEEELRRNLLLKRVSAIEKFARDQDRAEQARLNILIEKEFEAAKKIAKEWSKSFDQQIKDAEKMAEVVIGGQEYLTDKKIESIEEETEVNKRKLKESEEDSEALAKKQLEIDKMKRTAQIENAAYTFGMLASMSKEGSNTQKALAIADATISTYLSAQYAFESLAKIPVVGTVLGVAAAAAAVIFGLQNVARIAGVTFEEGGYTGSPGYNLRDAKGRRIAGLVHEEEFVFNKEKTKELRPLFEDIHSGRIDARGLAALTRRGVIMPLTQNDFNSKILEREVGKIYQKMQEKEPDRWIQKTDRGYIKKIGNTIINARS